MQLQLFSLLRQFLNVGGHVAKQSHRTSLHWVKLEKREGKYMNRKTTCAERLFIGWQWMKSTNQTAEPFVRFSVPLPAPSLKKGGDSLRRLYSLTTIHTYKLEIQSVAKFVAESWRILENLLSEASHHSDTSDTTCLSRAESSSHHGFAGQEHKATALIVNSTLARQAVFSIQPLNTSTGGQY